MNRNFESEVVLIMISHDIKIDYDRHNLIGRFSRET
jgi:hypothetical protein